MSIAITPNDVMLFLFTLLGTYLNIASFKPFRRICVNLKGAPSRGGRLL